MKKKKTMKTKIFNEIKISVFLVLFTACGIPKVVQKTENKLVPESFTGLKDTVNSALISWKVFFTDPDLLALIDTALKRNQELNILTQEIIIAQTEVQVRKGEYLPFVNAQAGAGFEKSGRYTRQGAVEENIEIKPGQEFPEPLPDFILSANISWEVDIWKKLRNAKKAAVYRYLSGTEGRHFATTLLISEIAKAYYELLALDNQLDILKKNIELQNKALEIIRTEKTAARVTELAVKKFEAEVYKNKSRQFEIEQKITETENNINFLIARYPRKITRNSNGFTSLVPDTIYAGIPSQLLQNRPDIKQAQLELEAAKLDVKVAKANFYPKLDIKAGLGLQAFDPGVLISTPESMIYSLAGDLIAPLINRNAIKAAYTSANTKQVQAVFNYESVLLKAYIEVYNQISNITNLKQNYEFKIQQVENLNQSIDISTNLFKSARADYMEILMTQRDALEATFELIETKKQQLNAVVDVYQALGGGWK